MADVQFDKVFSPAEATRGSWVPIDGSTIAGGIPSASRGRYTQLNYIVGSEPGALSLALSGGTVILPVSSVNISEPLAIENKEVLGVPVPLEVEITTSIPLTVSNTVSTTNIDYPNDTQIESTTIAANASAVITFSPEVNNLEIYNKDVNNAVYLSYNTGLAYNTVNNLGLPIEAEAFYSIDRTISGLVITNPNGTTTAVSIFGHYKA